MAIFECKLFSKELFASVCVNVILPTPDSGDYFLGTQTAFPKEGQKYQVLYLLHGISADHTDWARFSGIERYAQEKQLAVIMPGVSNSLYCNLIAGGNYYNYYTKELPEMMESLLPISAKRENTFIAGLSMGGFGAYKAALRNPEKYVAAASLSGGMSRVENRENVPIDTSKWSAAAYGKNGEYYNPNEEDLKVLLKKLIDSGRDIPKLYQACGTEDFIYAMNADFRDYARSIGAGLTYEESAGIHDWNFWDPYIRRVLDWLPTKGGFVD